MALEPLRIRDLSGGIADGHPAHIPDNCVEAAYNVEFWDGTCGGRRNGSTAVVSALTNAMISNGLFVHTPTASRTTDRLWTLSDATGLLRFYDSAYTGTNPTITDGDIIIYGSGVDWATVHGKLFIAAKRVTSAAAALDRLAVYDGTSVRRVGIAAPTAAPTAANNGVGTYSGARKWRVRLSVQSAGATIRRSEPSAELSFTPSGTGSGVTVTRPGTLEGATHWELEEVGSNGVDWYRIATTLIGTTTHTTTLALTAVATTGILSDDIGDYSLIPSAKYLTVDDDRLIYAGSHEDTTKGSRVAWTPVYSDASGVGNDERAPTDVSGFLDFDSLDGGDITGIRSWNGKVIVFKRGQTHQMVRTGGRSRAYLPDTLSKLHGAIPGSIMEGTDKNSQSCLLFIDQEAGPMMLSAAGLRILLDERMRRLWKTTFNRNAVNAVSCLWHVGKGQGWWHIAGPAANDPNIRWVYESSTEGIVFHTIPQAARAATYFNQFPHFTADTGSATNTNRIIKGDDPTATSDYGTNFRAYVKTKAYQLGGLVRRFAFVSAILEAKASAGLSLTVTFIRDYGLESKATTVWIAPVGSEEFVSVPMDNAFLAECQALSIEFGDPAARAVAAWQVYGWTVPWTMGSSTTGAQ